MTHEECFFVVIGVYEPTGDVVGIGGCEVARGGVKNVYAFYCYLDGVFCGAGEGDVGFAEQHEEAVVFAGFESFRHAQIIVHVGALNGNVAQSHDAFIGVAFKGESQHDEDIKKIGGFACRMGKQVFADSAVLRPHTDGGAFGDAFFPIVALKMQISALSQNGELIKDELFVFFAVIDAALTQLLKNDVYQDEAEG